MVIFNHAKKPTAVGVLLLLRKVIPRRMLEVELWKCFRNSKHTFFAMPKWKITKITEQKWGYIRHYGILSAPILNHPVFTFPQKPSPAAMDTTCARDNSPQQNSPKATSRSVCNVDDSYCRISCLVVQSARAALPSYNEGEVSIATCKVGTLFHEDAGIRTIFVKVVKGNEVCGGVSYFLTFEAIVDSWRDNWEEHSDYVYDVLTVRPAKHYPMK
ncbi:hypothetical protein L484_001531 [Morus notabilis]|uniref:Uncharacterized protein n=1 Tax=Morus notabilis TaxID=981085 RepID=W9SGZ2_9ROSA|nr:hypothetical protein L484_001531 [Morus notabilis]